MKYLVFIALIFFVSLNARAQIGDDANGPKYMHQLQLVDSLRSFIENDLNLIIPGNFYTKWRSGKDSMYVFLYVSKSNKIESPSLLLYNGWLMGSEDSAIIKSREFNAQGYQTLVYKTAGMSDARLSNKLLSYPDEAIAFIMCHEAVHRHLAAFYREPGFPYIFAEALCDAVANLACLQFAAKTKMLNVKAVLKQKELFEESYHFINEKRDEVEQGKVPNQQQFLKKCTAEIRSIIKHGNQFQKDRMLYPVNNAYFLRMGPYSLHYFEVLKMLQDKFDIDGVINTIQDWQIKKIENRDENGEILDLPVNPPLKSPWGLTDN